MSASARWLLALLAGALVGAGATFALLRLGGAAEHEVAAQEAVARPATSVASATPARPPEGAALEAEPSAKDDQRVAVCGSKAGAADEPSADLLLELIARGRREGWLLDGQLAEMLFWQLVAQGQLDEAWALATRHTPEQQHLFLNLASHAHRSGAFGLRDRALERALALGWVDPSFLAEIDPALALARYDQMIAAAEPSERLALQIGYARLLIGLGREDEALAIARERLAWNPNDESALDLLCSLDLAAGEAHLRRLIEARDPQNDWTRKLIGLLNENGRTAEAAEWLSRLQESGKPVYSGDWGSLADAYLAAGDNASAVEAWLAALELESGDPDPWTGPLMQHAPGKLLSALESRVASGEHDEYWGALGDARWASGSRDGALEAWKQAAALDPSDGEWASKLTLAAAGKDPLGE